MCATIFLAFFRSGVPFPAFENFLCAFARAFSSVRKNRGFSIFSPFERVANDSRPTSIPTVVSFRGRGEGSYSTEKQAYHFPVAERRIVRVLIVPSIGRWKTIFTSPIFERWRRSSSSLNPDRGYVKLSYRPFPLNRGNPGFSPAFTRRKKALKPRSTRI